MKIVETSTIVNIKLSFSSNYHAAIRQLGYIVNPILKNS